MAAKFILQVLTANRLADGEAVWWSADHRWSETLAGAEIAHDAEADEIRGKAADRRDGQAGRVDELGTGERLGAFHRHGEHSFEIHPAQVSRVPRAIVGPGTWSHVSVILPPGPEIVKRLK